MEMQKIVELIQSLGAGGKDAFIAWLYIYNGTWVLVTVLVCLTVYKVIMRICKATAKAADRDARNGENEWALRQLRDNLNIGCSGPMTVSERRQVLERVARLVADKAQPPTELEG